MANYYCGMMSNEKNSLSRFDIIDGGCLEDFADWCEEVSRKSS